MALWLSFNAGSLGIRKIIHNPLGVWTAGKGWQPYIPSPSVQAFAGPSAWHYDHIHVGTYDRGGLLQPGLTLVENATGRPETVLSPDDARQLLHDRSDGELAGEMRQLRRAFNRMVDRQLRLIRQGAL
jgi:hypothetical protein